MGFTARRCGTTWRPSAGHVGSPGEVCKVKADAGSLLTDQSDRSDQQAQRPASDGQAHV